MSNCLYLQVRNTVASNICVTNPGPRAGHEHFVSLYYRQIILVRFHSLHTTQIRIKMWGQTRTMKNIISVKELLISKTETSLINKAQLILFDTTRTHLGMKSVNFNFKS